MQYNERDIVKQSTLCFGIIINFHMPIFYMIETTFLMLVSALVFEKNCTRLILRMVVWNS